MQVLAMTSKGGIKTNADVNAKNWLTKENVIMDLFGILVIVIENVLNYDVGEYLDYKNCKWKNKLVDKLAEKQSKEIDGNEMIYNGTFYDYKNVCNTCTIYIVLFVIGFLIIISISSAGT